MMEQIVAGVFCARRPLRFLGVEVGARMTVLQLDGGLLYSPIDVDEQAVTALGKPRWVVAPNKLHHLFAGPWLERGLEGWAAPGLAEKRSDLNFVGTLDRGEHPFGDAVETLTLTCFPMTNEVVLFHRPSRTLVVTDFVFNFAPTAPWFTRFAMRGAGCYPGCRASHLERALMKRDVARRELATMLRWDFERIIPAHGEVVTGDARRALVDAYHWLGVGG
ncbi:hypothetical protein [Acanthopleuribacter pedis]|uniref:DUF4336 domain-containing protein n=1 Tax=Acanthopleuribacter pedis TaxID=442870 RepID=A0A8J7Q8R5_9BACT|nr:hypothetical protein [Acanthopleuribacter pedis]MBO1319509.1 hypothetical protein [Acanthopleuribacter pedis]